MLITLTGAGAGDAGAACGVVNTAVRLDTAAGPATVGTAFCSRLAADGDFVDATQTSCSPASPCSPRHCWPASGSLARHRRPRRAAHTDIPAASSDRR